MTAPNIWPISFTEANVRAIRDGTKIETRRPAGRLGNCRPGDRLWIREPFHLSAKLDGIAPSQAVARGYGINFFATDIVIATDASVRSVFVNDLPIGKRRTARELPKVLHRYHLIVRSVRREPLHAIVQAGALAEGVASVADYAALWATIYPQGKTIAGTPVRWADNPLVDVLAFDFVPYPLAAQTKETDR